MRIIEYIKQKLGIGKKQKLLMEHNPKTIEEETKIAEMTNKDTQSTKQKTVLEKYKVEKAPKTYKTGTIEYAIEQYLASVLYNYKNKGYYNSYNSLISLSGMPSEEEGNNAINEEKFLQEVKNKKYNKTMEMTVQRNKKTQEPVFYHIVTNNSYTGKYRIYLNCQKKNTAELAGKLATELGNQGYYFKFNANSAKTARAEQFVFYCKGEKDLIEKIKTIEQTKAKYPELFKGSENTNPFLKNVDGYIAYAPEPEKGKYTPIFGNEEKEIAKSYNALLSEGLKDALFHSLKDMKSFMPQLAPKMKEKNCLDYNSVEQYIDQILEKAYVNEERKEVLINLMKTYLTTVQQKNPELDIIGIDKQPVNTQSKEERQ